MMTSARRSFTMKLGTLFTVGWLLLAGCAPAGEVSKVTPEEVSKVTPEELHDAVLGIVDDTIVFLGNTWPPLAGPIGPDPCLIIGDNGMVTYSTGRIGPPSTDPEADIARVEGYWKSLGMRTYIVRNSERNPRNTTIHLTGRGDIIDSIIYSADTRLTSLDAGGVCVPGDWRKLIDEYDGGTGT